MLPIRTGTVPLAPGYLYRPEGSGLLEALGRGVPREAMVRCPIGAFLVEHPERGPVLIDTGMHPVVATDPKANLGRAAAAIMGGLRIGPDENVPAFLRARGIAPDDVELVVMTHLHPDHTSAMSAFARARFAIARAEWRAARGRRALLGGYLGRHLPDESRVWSQDLALHGRPWEGFERTLDLLGDGTLRLVSTPGHTAGHVSVLVETGDGPVFVLGDAVYTLRNLHEDLLPRLAASDAASRASMRAIRAYHERHPEVPLVPTHDPEVWAALGA